MKWLRTVFFTVGGLGLLVLPGLAFNESKIIDLTHAFDEQTISWPTAKQYELEVVAAEKTQAGYWYAANNLCLAEHSGTHMDAPIHFAEGKRAASEVPVEQLIGPAVVIDVSAQAAKDADYRVTIGDLKSWEAEYGQIPPGALVLMFSDWGQYWPDKKQYLGTEKPGDVANLHFPSFSKEAAEFLIAERSIDAIGVDTPSIDYGQSKDFIVHQIINGADKPALENIANLDQLPPHGATLIALPMKIAKGSGGPVRIIAILP